MPSSANQAAKKLLKAEREYELSLIELKREASERDFSPEGDIRFNRLLKQTKELWLGRWMAARDYERFGSFYYNRIDERPINPSISPDSDDTQESKS